ncbi:MAG: hypothetical protein ACFE75_00135 [Candidatus Hodarchaeota archaeon]
MSLNNIEKKRRQRKQLLKGVICLLLTMIIMLNFLLINDSNFKINNPEVFLPIDESDKQENLLDNKITTAGTSILRNPFTVNFELLRAFFENKYQSSLDFEVPMYFRYGDTDGDITDDTIFSEDNLLYYKSLKKMEISKTTTFDMYLKLKETPLWYEGNNGQFNYGFVESIDNSTSQVKNSDRYLYDNLLPIFLLIGNIGYDLDDFSIDGIFPEDSINEMFYLINSSEFWDGSNYGFYNHNSTSDKYLESNFYSVLANLLIHRVYQDPKYDISIRDRAYELANLTMIAINNSMWSTSGKAFYHHSDTNWNPFIVLFGTNYHLSTNALGIITFLEFWIKTGMKNDSTYYPYFQKAIDVYNSLDNNLWDDINNLYENIAQPDWTVIDSTPDLKANALMMSACLKLFEITGNYTYYNRALQIFNGIETNLYDNVNNAYDFNLANNSKNFNSNLGLSEAYLDAFEIYNSTILIATYNVSNDIPDFIFNHDTLNLTSSYSFKKTNEYYNPDSNSYLSFTVQYDITNASITYLLKYPNGTFFYQLEDQIVDPVTSSTLLYNVEESLPMGDGYFIYVWANTTYFKMAQDLKRFNVSSGLINTTINGLISTLYQGPIVNVSLVINNTRRDNLTVTASLEGQEIKYYAPQVINFTASKQIIISFNLTAKTGAIPGKTEIFFKIKQGNVIYLKIKRIIEIGYSFDYSNLLYQSKVVPGDNIFVSMNIKNFLPNATQSLNISFTGITQNSIDDYVKEETLNENEIRAVSYNLKSLESITDETIKIKMNILINTTEYYSEVFTIQIIDKFEILSVSFPERVPQGVLAYLIIIIRNNQENSEPFSLYINGEGIATNIVELNTGENRIFVQIMPTINPYEFGIKKYRIVLKDSVEEEFARFYFEVAIELSTLNLIIFYVLPIIIPIGIILFFKNKDIKFKKLRR